MAVKAINRVCKVGSGYAVFLPVGWIRYYNLKSGSLVEVIADDDVIIKPIKSGGMENEVSKN